MDNNDNKQEELKRELLKDNFPSNNKTKKVEKSIDEDKQVKKIISGSVRKQKKGFGKRIAENLLEDDAQSVGDYILYDVIIPSVKDLIFNALTGGLEASLFGGKRGARTSRDRGRSYVSYDRVSYNSTRDRDRDRESRDVSRRSRATHRFDDLVLDSRGEAEEVISHLVDLTIDYGQATVADLYDLLGVTSDFTDNKHGWTDLRGASVTRARGGGYLLDLPRTRPLD